MKYILLSILLITSVAHSSELSYVKTDSPRDTMETFMEAMSDYREGLINNNPTKRARIYDAIRCFSEKSSAVITSQREKELAAILLKEVIDRVILIDLSLIPVTPPKNRWRLKNTEIVLKPELSGDRQDEWLITESSWKRAQLFYHRVNHLPYIEGSTQGALYIQPWMETYLPQWSKEETLRLKNWQWLGILFGLFVGLIIRFLARLIIIFIKSFKLVGQQEWVNDLFNQIEKPSSLLIAALFWYAWSYYLKLEGLAFGIVNGFIQIIFGIAVTWAVYQVVGVFCTYLKEKAQHTESTLDDQLIPFVEKTLKLVIIMLGALIVLQNMGVNVFSLLAGLGLGGLAFALAAKDTAANLFGSIMILIDRPFKIGDWVKIDSTEGTVEEIGFRSTRIRTFYNSLITVPNANMANAQIDNMGERQYRRTSTTLDVVYNTSPEKLQLFIEGIRSIIQAAEITRKDYYHVYFSGYGESSLKILVYFFFITNDWSVELAERQKIYLEIFNLAEKLNVEFAYPTQTLFVEKTAPNP